MGEGVRGTEWSPQAPSPPVCCDGAVSSVSGLEHLCAGRLAVVVPTPTSPSPLPYPGYPRPFLLQSTERRSLKPKLPHWRTGSAWHPRISSGSFVRWEVSTVGGGVGVLCDVISMSLRTRSGTWIPYPHVIKSGWLVIFTVLT